MNDRPIDKVRRSAGAMTIGTPEDGNGPMVPCEIDKSLHFIKEKAIYRMQLADDIDPDRTNINVPNTNQKVLDIGTDSILVRRTLMPARRLFRENVYAQAFDYKAAISKCFDALKDFAAMDAIHKDLVAKVIKMDDHIKGLAPDKNRSLALPSVGDVKGWTENYLQKADHAAKNLFYLAQQFYGDAIGKSWFESLLTLLAEKYGPDDAFTKFLADDLTFLQFVRNARNSIEHPKENMHVDIQDIRLTPDGTVAPPTITVVHPETPQPVVALGDFMEMLLDRLSVTFEVMMAYLAAANIQAKDGFPLMVIAHDDSRQKHYYCRYGLGAQLGDQVAPYG